jgi:hypothetical protein
MAVAGALCLTPGTVRADKPVAPADLAVDQVSLRGGPRLLGAVLGREADGTLAIAVGRAWLKKTHPKFYEQALRDETVETRAALTELRDRIADWRKSRPDERELDFFLGREAERVESELKAFEAGTRSEVAQFMVLDLAPGKIEHVVNQPPQRKRVAAAAWREGLADVETRSVAGLSQELTKLKADQVDDADALLDSLPPRRQNEAAWAARRAIVEYRFRKPLDFQGTGDVVVRAGDAPKAVDLAQLIDGILKSVGGDALGDLADPPAAGGGSRKPPRNNGSAEKWLATATRMAEADGVEGFRVTRVEQDLAAKRGFRTANGEPCGREPKRPMPRNRAPMSNNRSRTIPRYAARWSCSRRSVPVARSRSGWRSALGRRRPRPRKRPTAVSSSSATAACAASTARCCASSPSRRRRRGKNNSRTEYEARPHLAAGRERRNARHQRLPPLDGVLSRPRLAGARRSRYDNREFSWPRRPHD